MHLLELAKTAWNAKILSNEANDAENQALKKQVKVFLALASQALTILGKEGDTDGPLQEVAILQNLVRNE